AAGIPQARCVNFAAVAGDNAACRISSGIFGLSPSFAAGSSPTRVLTRARGVRCGRQFRRLSVQPAKESNVTSYEQRGPRYGAAHRQLLLAQAPARKLVLKWREDWRAEMVRRKRQGRKVYEAAPDGGLAGALARSEFGRFYWNGQLDRQLASAMKRRPKKAGQSRDGGKRDGKPLK